MPVLEIIVFITSAAMSEAETVAKLPPNFPMAVRLASIKNTFFIFIISLC